MKEEKLMGILMKHNIVSFEASALALNGLSISNLRNSHVIETFLTGFSTILNGISLFDSTTFRIYKQADSINFKLRQLNRNLARQLDSFINMIERLPSPEIPSTPFLQSVQQMQDKLCDVLFSMADIISHALISLVEEMYRNNRNEVLEKKLLPSFKIFNESVATVRSQAVGQTASDFAGVLIQIEFHFNNFIDCSSKINFTKSLFPVKKLLEISGNMGESIMRLSKIVPTLTDILIINPDPDSADKIPEKFEPKMTNQQISDNLTPHDVLSSIQSQSTKILNNLTEAKKVFSEYSVDSDVIIEIIEKIDNDSNKFISFSRQMISVCTDQRLGELQTSIFSFISVVSNLHVAIRNRLLREGNFDQDINEAISQFGPQIESTINLASAAVKNFEEKSAVIEEEIIDTIEDTSSASDEVTRELQATANAINEMNARLAKFSAQISTIEEPIQDEGIDIIDENTNDLAEESNNGLQRQEMNLNAEQGTLPAFVISNASPVLEMTSLILQRAQVITKQKMMESGGHLQNEKALIKCAQDLSEAAELLLIVAEILISKAESDTEYKVISAAKIIKASVAAFVAKIQQLGGDSEGKMIEYVKKVVIHADAVVTKGESIAIEKMIEEESKVQKKVMNKFTLRLNLQSDLNNLETVLKQQEDALKQFNRKF
ncbi:hypothetical protein TRFO_25151 [Tritrichomonas foetus]|uniref:I/LWEQ domain-containing protein n=1 Tax=Tritrichomonas foetus TaxID=1144522 RepID=A0A1J4K5L9_9EUKA|nr:hypothetical protein TRFO_25151 [Tritrichomonas foetus]|eukprot:OHT06695.1 hypothetical protein TRFO_25151 [Tritrichomonas foetus]